MYLNLITIAILALTASGSPRVVERDDTPKPAKSGFGGFSGLGKGSSGSTPSSPGGGLDGTYFPTVPPSNLGMMSSSDIKKGGFTCKKAVLIFARGTGEPGNMGFVVGPSLGGGLKKSMNGDCLIQGVDYSTNFSGGGAREITNLVKMVIPKCPDMAIILGGYSQGAMQVHQALGSLGVDASKIAVAVTFGDPYSNQGWGTGGIVGSVVGLGGSPGASAEAGRTKSAGNSGGGVNGFNPNNGLIICSNGDFVCGVVPNIGGAKPKATASDTAPSKAGAGHLSYGADGSIPRAIAFIVARVDGKGSASSIITTAPPASGSRAKPKSVTPQKTLSRHQQRSLQLRQQPTHQLENGNHLQSRRAGLYSLLEFSYR
ncbi:hypothetical protein FKW77_006720 [Venturia effusa]|uniref:cutinase n=1 Tax=Venturia effusa TaxID=50376 RepID=A0A517LQF4_9PEZI|nr:hypothetical protein FKW77_006720 [Venturia effusa]